MKRILLIGFLSTFLNNCITQNDRVSDIVTNQNLLTNLTDIINHVDSLTNSIPTYGNIKSFLITFNEEDSRCYVKIEGDFKYYDSKAMNGYFIYKNKAISVYGISSNCGNVFINKNKLRKGEIEGLIDFDNEQFNKAIKLNLTPLPPPPPREPYYRLFLLINKDSLKLIDEYNPDSARL